MSNRYSEILQKLEKKAATLVAVSKTRTEEEIMNIYNEGHRIFGENRVQELTKKYETLPKDIEWHLIGHLQKNKVKYIASFVTMIHSVDTVELAQVIDKQAEKNNRTQDILIQLKIASELTKHGLQQDDFAASVNAILALKNIRIRGFMGMASFTADVDQVRTEFKQLKTVYNQFKLSHFQHDESFDTLSMGMSGDYELALEEGSTMVRIGSLLFNQ